MRLFSFGTTHPPTAQESDISFLRLIRSRRVGPATFHRLLEEHGSLKAALAVLPEMAAKAGVTGYQVCPEGVAAAELAAGRKANARLIRCDQPDYPPLLRQIDGAPPAFWVKGNAAALLRPAVAVIGARSASSLGLRMARNLAAQLGSSGCVIVAGLARGIDSAAHEASIGTGTVAVMAGGIDVIYPAENRTLAAMICEGGCLVSEQPPGVAPMARHFPLRNRIISGLSHGVVVVEAAVRSGSLITAKDALDQGREVLAVPGHPVDGRAGGCNQLIRDGAVLVRNATDVLSALPGLQEALDEAAYAMAHAIESAPDAVPTRSSRRLGQRLSALVKIPASVSDNPEPRCPSGAAVGYEGTADTASALPPTDISDPQHDTACHAQKVATADCLTPGPDQLEARVLQYLSPSPTEENCLIRDVGLPARLIAPVLLQLELSGRLTRLAGGKIALI